MERQDGATVAVDVDVGFGVADGSTCVGGGNGPGGVGLIPTVETSTTLWAQAASKIVRIMETATRFIFLNFEILLSKIRRRHPVPHFDAAKGFDISHPVKSGQVRVVDLDIFHLRIEPRILIMQM